MKHTKSVGIEISQRGIRIVQLAKRGKTEIYLEKCFFIPFPHPPSQPSEETFPPSDFSNNQQLTTNNQRQPSDLPHNFTEPIIKENVILNKQLAAKLLKNAFQQNAISTKNVVLSITGKKIFTKSLELPVMSMGETRETIKLGLTRYIPIPPQKAFFDILTTSTSTKLQEKTQKVSLCVAEEDIVRSRLETLEMAGLKLSSVEIGLVSILRLFTPLLLSINKPVAVLHISDGISEFAIVEKQYIQFSRTIPIALHPEQTHDSSPKLFNSIIEEIRKSLEFFKRSCKQEEQIASLIISGSAINTKELSSAISREINIPTQIIDSLAHLDIASNESDNEFAKSSGEFFPSVGAALAGSGIYPNLNINLIHASVPTKTTVSSFPSQKGMNINLWATVFLIAIIVTSLFYGGYLYITYISLAKQLSISQNSAQGDRKILEENKAVKKENEIFKNYLGFTVYLKEHKRDWTKVLEALSEAQTEGVWLFRFRTLNYSCVEISGISVSQVLISKFTNKLKQSPIVTEVNLTSTSMDVRGNTEVVRFSMYVFLNKSQKQ